MTSSQPDPPPGAGTGTGRKRAPILVTGSHRSGTTWVGHMLAAAPGTGYVHEPFNISLRFGAGPALGCWYRYLDPRGDDEFVPAFDRLLAGRYPLRRNLGRVRSPRDLVQLAKHCARFRKSTRPGTRLLVKDPIAFFSAPWLHARFGFDVVVMIRHPAAFCSSLKLKAWDFDFSHLARQPALIDDLLDGYRNEIREYAAEEHDLIDNAILLWNCIHSVALHFRERHPGWHFVRHEDLSREPAAGFAALFAALDLDFTPAARAAIEAASGAHNPAEQQAGDEFVRDSRRNIGNWKRRLTDAEIERIRAGTNRVAREFYGPGDW